MVTSLSPSSDRSDGKQGGDKTCPVTLPSLLICALSINQSVYCSLLTLLLYFVSSSLKEFSSRKTFFLKQRENWHYRNSSVLSLVIDFFYRSNLFSVSTKSIESGVSIYRF